MPVRVEGVVADHGAAPNDPDDLAGSIRALARFAVEDLDPRIEELRMVAGMALIELASVARAWSGSNLGPQAAMYYGEFEPPPRGRHWDSVWGVVHVQVGWDHRTEDEIQARVSRAIGQPFGLIEIAATALNLHVDEFAHGAALLFEGSRQTQGSIALQERLAEIVGLTAAKDVDQVIRGWMPTSWTSRDSVSFAAGPVPAPHQRVLAAALRAQSIADRAASLTAPTCSSGCEARTGRHWVHARGCVPCRPDERRRTGSRPGSPSQGQASSWVQVDGITLLVALSGGGCADKTAAHRRSSRSELRTAPTAA